MTVKNILSKCWQRVYPPSRCAFHMQRMVMNPRHRETLSRWSARRLPKSVVDTGGVDGAEEKNLNCNGYTMLPSLVKSGEVSDVVSWLEGKQVYDRWKPDAGDFGADNPRSDCHTALYHTEDVVNCPHVMRWANSPDILSLVGNVLGAKPTISNLSIWWSYPGHDAPQEAEYFHRDVDDLRFIKLFVYLTDVDDGCGPHVYVPGSHRRNQFRKIRRYRDDEVTDVFGNDGIKYYTGTNGTAFLENTFGLHKGLLPTHSRRLLFQAQYSLHPIGIYTYSPVERTREEGMALDPYINRLFISP